MSEITPATLQSTMPVQIADWLAIEIIEERYGPGARLNEQALAQHFGVSRAPVREALRILESRALVTITPQRGARVTALSYEEVDHLFEIRAALVGLAGRLAASRRTAAALEELERLLADLEGALEMPDAYARASAAATLAVARASGNPKLAAMIVSFAHQIGRYARLGLSSQARRERSIQNWRSTISAIRSRDVELAEMMQRTLATENRKAALAALEHRIEG